MFIRLEIVEYLKIVHFVPPKLLKLKIHCWKQREFVQSNISFFNRKTSFKSYGRLFIRYTALLNIEYKWLIEKKMNLIYDQSLIGMQRMDRVVATILMAWCHWLLQWGLKFDCSLNALDTTHVQTIDYDFNRDLCTHYFQYLGFNVLLIK